MDISTNEAARAVARDRIAAKMPLAPQNRHKKALMF
jgi:hypothetical protein